MLKEKRVRKGIVALLITVGLYACTSVPETYFATDIQVVTEDQLKDFWQAGNETVSFRASPGFKSVSGRGYVVIQYLINSNGAVFNPEIIESQPAGIYDRTARKYLSLVRYIPAETNPVPIPAKTIQKTSFTWKGQECESQT